MKDYFVYETKQRSWCNGLIPTPIQIDRWNWHKNNILNPIREHLGVPVQINDGIRNDATTQSMLAKGWSPSLKSDHYGGLPTILTNPSHIAKFGHKIYWYSTFATDIDGKFNHRQLCRDIYLTLDRQVVNLHPSYISGLLGAEQVILESQMKNGNLKTWIHIASPLEAFFSIQQAIIIRKLRKNIRFMEFKDGSYFESNFK